MRLRALIFLLVLLQATVFGQWTRDLNYPKRIKPYNATDTVYVLLINGLPVRQGISLSDTTQFQLTISNIADTSKYVEYSDSSTTNGWYRRGYVDALLATKQAVIANIADTTKYFKTYDSSGTNGWYRRGYVDALMATKQAVIGNLADTTKYFKTYDSAGSTGWYRRAYVDAALAVKQATIDNLADTAKYIEVSDTLTLYAGKFGGWTEIVRSADTTDGGVATYRSLGELHFSMAASGCYEIDAHLFFTKATDAKAYSVALNCTGTPTNIGLVASGLGAAADGTDLTAQSIVNSAADSLQLTVATVGNNKLEEVIFRGMIINEAAVNLFGFKWHAETNGAVTLKRGSYLRYRRPY